MKKLLVSFIVVSAFSLAAQAQEAHLDLVTDGRPVTTIVKSVGAPKWTNRAVAWLNEYIEKVSGANRAVITEGNEILAGTLARCVDRPITFAPTTDRSSLPRRNASAVEW